MTRRSALAAAALALVAAAPALPDLAVGSFSNLRPGGAIPGWEEMRLGDAPRSEYALVRDGGQTVVRAEADGSASGIVRKVRIDPAEYPVLRWRWRVENVHARGDVRRKSGDDYPARIYVTFDYDASRLSFGDRVKYRALRALGYRDVPLRALNYIWANKPGETRIVPNPYTGWVQMVPVESGPANVGTWREGRRNVAADYRAAFGEEPPAITGVAIMTDGDNTGGQAVAYFGDITASAR